MVLKGFIMNTKILLKMFKKQKRFQNPETAFYFLVMFLAKFLFSEPEENSAQNSGNCQRKQ